MAAIVAHSLTRQLGTVYASHPYLLVSVVWAVAIVVLVALSGYLRVPRMRAALAALLLAADAFVLFVVPQLSAPRAVGVDTAPVTYLRRHLGLERYFTHGPLAPNYGAYFGLASANAVDVPVTTAFQHFVHRRLDQAVDPTAFVGNTAEFLKNLPGYRDAAVAYVLTPAGQALPTGNRFGLTLVDRTPTTSIYHLARAARCMSSTNPTCSVDPTSRTSAVSTCSRSTLLIRRETYIPGWTATVDGRAAAIHPDDRIFQAVKVPAGSHRVAFGYSPPSVGWGALAFLVGVAALFAPPGLRRLTRRGLRACPATTGSRR